MLLHFSHLYTQKEGYFYNTILEVYLQDELNTIFIQCNSFLEKRKKKERKKEKLTASSENPRS